MKYGNQLVGNHQLNAYFSHFVGHLTCSHKFGRYKIPRKLKTVNIYPHVFEAKREIWRRENIPFKGIILYILKGKKRNIKRYECLPYLKFSDPLYEAHLFDFGLR